MFLCVCMGWHFSIACHRFGEMVHIEILDNRIFPPHYFVLQDRSGRGEGVAMLARDDLAFLRQQECEDVQCASCTVFIQQMRFSSRTVILFLM